MPKKNIKVDAFQDFLLKNLSVKAYNSLTEKMSISSNRWTRILNNPFSTTADEVREVAKLLNEHPYELIIKFGLGREVITIAEMDDIESDYTIQQN